VIKILAFMGSPRFGGNTHILFEEVMASARSHGAETEEINLYGIDITPCIECGGCDETPYSLKGVLPLLRAIY